MRQTAFGHGEAAMYSLFAPYIIYRRTQVREPLLGGGADASHRRALSLFIPYNGNTSLLVYQGEGKSEEFGVEAFGSGSVEESKVYRNARWATL